MVSVDRAKALRERGLVWHPSSHDKFMIPDRDLDDKVFALSDLTVDLQQIGGIATITFNGAVEWSLDYIFSSDVVWLPSESQLRQLLGDHLVGLTRSPDGYECLIQVGEHRVAFCRSDASDAYAAALEYVLEHSD